MTELHDIDLAHVRRIADRACNSSGRLGMAGEGLLTVIHVVDLADEISAETPGFADMLVRAAETLETQWAILWDAAGLPRRPLPRLSSTRH